LAVAPLLELLDAETVEGKNNLANTLVLTIFLEEEIFEYSNPSFAQQSIHSPALSKISSLQISNLDHHCPKDV
jgi:hypothetical protein